MKMKICFLVGALCISNVSSAQNVPFSADSTTALSKRISVKSTPPKAGICDAKERDRINCFRVMLELSPSRSENIGVAGHWAGNIGTAFTASASQCEAKLNRGVGKGGWDSVRDKWNLDRVTFIDQTKPAIAIVDFYCDFPVMKGEEVTFQVAFDLYISPREFGEGRYIFKKIVLE